MDISKIGVILYDYKELILLICLPAIPKHISLFFQINSQERTKRFDINSREKIKILEIESNKEIELLKENNRNEEINLNLRFHSKRKSFKTFSAVIMRRFYFAENPLWTEKIILLIYLVITKKN